MKRFRPLALLGGLLLAPTLAFAAPSGSWAGPHIGVLFGANSVSSDSTSNEVAFATTFMAGYDWQLARHFVLGVDGFYQWNADKTHDIENCAGCTVSYGSKVYGLTGRAGFPFGKGNVFMPYVKLGYGWYNLSGDVSNSAGSVRYGVGFEWMSDTGTASLLVQFTHQSLDTPGGSGLGTISNNIFSIGANFFF
ncbi:MAG: porin family protein [Gammaproteobacteria bacterium]|nr:porin family protein [Gammaproteobacteria bacterium]